MRTCNLARVSLAAGILVLSSPALAQDTPYRHEVDTSVALERGGTLSVSVYRGSVSVTGVAGTTVRIKGTVERGELALRARPTGVTVTTEREGRRGARADLDITVPMGTRLLLEGFAAPFAVRGVKGEAKIESLSGSVQVTDAVGKVDVATVSGSIDVGQVKGDLRAEAVSGRVVLADIEGDIESESVSGRISITGANSRLVRAETVSGPITYSGTFAPGGNYVFKSHSGPLTLGVPSDASATVSIETFSGNVDSEFPVTLEAGTNRTRHGSTFEFRIGHGRARIVAETFGGDVRIRRADSRDSRE